MEKIRLALAGGSDQRPPHDEPRNAQIIRFPIERRVPPQPESPVDRPSPVMDDGHKAEHSPVRVETSPPQWPRVFPGL